MKSAVLCCLLAVCFVQMVHAACSYTLSPTSASFTSAGGTNSFTVSVGSSCSWSAATTNSWIHTNSPASGTGNGLVNYTVDTNGTASARTGAITVGTKTFTITQSAPPPTLASGVDDNLVWTTGGTVNGDPSNLLWSVVTDVTYDGVDAVVSGNKFKPNSTSWIQTTVVGPGTLTFWWKVDSDVTYPTNLISFDYLEFLINGNEPDESAIIMGQIDWNYRSYSIPEGTNTVTWQYVKDPMFNSGNDSAWLDQVSYTTAASISIPTAIDTCQGTWTTGGNTNTTYWAGQTNTTHDGISAVQSGAIYTSQESWMQVVVSGATNVSFWWKVSSQTNNDFLEFYTNGVFVKRISGEVNWQSNFFKLTATTNTLKWRYWMTNFIAPGVALGQNAGWVDQVSFSPGGDSTPPAIVYSFTNLTLTAGSNCQATLPDLTGTNYFLAIDTCSSVTVTQSPLAGTLLSAGTNKVVLTAVDASGNASRSTNNVIIADLDPPVVTILGSNPLIVECHGAFGDPGATAQDACAGTVAVVTNSTVNPNETGAYSIQYIATDPSGNSATNTRTVNVVDTTPPAVTLIGSNSITVECHGSFSDPGATATDACAGSRGVTTNGTVNVNATGSYTIRYSASDPSGNSATNTRTVNVVDTTPPLVTLIGSNSITVECHGTFNDPGATASDVCSGSLSASTNGSVNANATGSYTIQYVATDLSGNSATNTRTVNVVDTTAPSITLLFTNLTLAVSTNCSAIVPDLTGTNFTVAVDSCSTVTVTQAPPAATSLPLGTNQIVLTAFDTSGNASRATNFLVVADTTPPTISGPADVQVNASTGLCSATNVALGTPSTSDNCTVASVTNNAPASFPVGTNLVTWTVFDAAGNSATSTQRVVVVDNQAPTISCPATVTVDADAGQNYASGVSLGTPTTSDNCGVAGVTNDAPSHFPLGTNTVVWTVTDIHGNTNTCAQQVIVNTRPNLPFSITSIVRNNDNTITLTLSGEASTDYAILASSNLVNWVSLHTNTTDPEGTFSYTDLDAGGFAMRFYRGVRP